jgi:hypothetical protein
MSVTREEQQVLLPRWPRPRLAGAVLGVGLPFGMAWIAGMMLHK